MFGIDWIIIFVVTSIISTAATAYTAYEASEEAEDKAEELQAIRMEQQNLVKEQRDMELLEATKQLEKKVRANKAAYASLLAARGLGTEKEKFGVSANVFDRLETEKAGALSVFQKEKDMLNQQLDLQVGYQDVANDPYSPSSLAIGASVLGSVAGDVANVAAPYAAKGLGSLWDTNDPIWDNKDIYGGGGGLP